MTSRTWGRTRSLRWLVSASLSGALILLPFPAAGQRGSSAQVGSERLAPASAGNETICHGKGFGEVKVADEHCGFVDRARKDAALDAACRLAEADQEILQARAEEKAEGNCRHLLGSEELRCSGATRRWENTYTHVLSGKCWAECGWAYVFTCVPNEGPEDG